MGGTDKDGDTAMTAFEEAQQWEAAAGKRQRKGEDEEELPIFAATQLCRDPKDASGQEL